MRNDDFRGPSCVTILVKTVIFISFQAWVRGMMDRWSGNGFGHFQGRPKAAIPPIGGYHCGPPRSTVGMGGYTIKEGKGSEIIVGDQHVLSQWASDFCMFELGCFAHGILLVCFDSLTKPYSGGRVIYKHFLCTPHVDGPN